MKVKTKIPDGHLQACFRAGMAAHEATSLIGDVFKSYRANAGSMKKMAKDGAGVSLSRAAFEVARVARILPEARKPAMLIHRTATKWAERLSYDQKATGTVGKTFTEDLRKMAARLQEMYSDSLSACGRKTSEDKVLEILYPERHIKK